MKKIIVLFFVVLLLPCFTVQSQMAVIDAALNSLMTISGIDQIIHYAQMVADNITQIQHMVQMVQNGRDQIERAMKNLSSAKDISSWSDFTSWYNRQLYLERRTMETFQNMNVSIGDKSYHLTDIEGIVSGYKDQTKEYWDNEFTEEQRRAMWINLGLTPSNYAFVQPFRAKALDIAREGLTQREVQNEYYTRQMERNKERLDRMARDNTLDNDDSDKMTEKELLMYILETLTESNKVTNDLAMQGAAILEKFAVDFYLDQTPVDKLAVSHWPEDGFTRLGPSSR